MGRICTFVSITFSHLLLLFFALATEIPGPNRNKNPSNGGGKGGGGGGAGGLDADANDILKQKQQVKVTYQPDDEELQYGSAEDFDGDGGYGDGGGPAGGLTPLSPHVYYTSGNKPATHKPGSSGGNQHQHQHQQHHHHHHHQQHGTGTGPGGAGGAGAGAGGGAGGEVAGGGITRKPTYYGGNTEGRVPIDNNEMSNGGSRGHTPRCPIQLLLLLLTLPLSLSLSRSLSLSLDSWTPWSRRQCRQPLLMGLSAVSGFLLTLSLCLL